MTLGFSAMMSVFPMLCVECLDDETLAWQTISIFAPAQLGKKPVNL
jgi:hypothetical protein